MKAWQESVSKSFQSPLGENELTQHAMQPINAPFQAFPAAGVAVGESIHKGTHKGT
jgi:hypothetical protein